MAQTTTLSPTPARDVLTRDEADVRARRVGDVSYDIDIDLPSDGSAYRGRTAIDFALASRAEPLVIDFKGGRVESMTVNGRPVEPDVRDRRLWLPMDLLTDRMRVELTYENPYDDTGDGLHHFLDPEDGQSYVYSNFQPFAAHRLFPSFDQPDIKATFDLSVTAPADWEVISASRPESIEPAGEGRRGHRFERTARFSTYLLPLVAGPYAAVRSEHRGIPLAIYGRRTMQNWLQEHAAEIFEITKQGFDYYSDLFDQPYPFTKYDQLFMPEFNIGAMENVGAVTFHDGYLFRDPPTDVQRQERAEVILHELAHMWFGNLVTMRWWDDLWLNESFATYISFLALTEATRFQGAWKTFNGSVKLWAYRQDQLVTTHPISADTPDTETALLNFDDITYGKGASVLKQLVATIGIDGFREGMRTYFRRHAWGNATLADFLAALEEGSGASLGQWARLWLETASLNTIAAEWSGTDGRVTSMKVVQTAPPAFPTLRPHAMQVALVSESADGLRVTALPAAIDGPHAGIAEAAGSPAPALVFPNHEDHDYALALLDERSLEFVRERLSDIQDPLLRQLLWTSLWDMVWDAQLPSVEYLRIVRRALPAEGDLELVDAVLERVAVAAGWYVPESVREREASSVVATALESIRTTDSSDLRITWMRSAIAAAATTPDLEPLIAIADGHETIPGFEVDQDMRWNLAIKSLAMGIPGADERIAAERDRDRSDRGARALIKAEASRPTAAAKREAWDRINGEGYGSYHLTRAAMQGFVWPWQRDLVLPFREPFFTGLRHVFEVQDHPFARSYLMNLFQDRWAEPEVLADAEALLGLLDPTAEPALERQLREEIDDLARAIRVRALAEHEAKAD